MTQQDALLAVLRANYAIGVSVALNTAESIQARIDEHDAALPEGTMIDDDDALTAVAEAAKALEDAARSLRAALKEETDG